MELQHQEDAGELEYEWISQYGEACKISGAFGVRLSPFLVVIFRVSYFLHSKSSLCSRIQKPCITLSKPQVTVTLNPPTRIKASA